MSAARNRIRLIDRFVPDMHRYMQAADCLWLPSLEEGLGNVMLEALCCGVPCLINRNLGLDEHVTSGANGSEVDLEPAAWCAGAAALVPLMADFARRTAISAAAHGRYDAHSFDQVFYSKLIALTDSLDR